MAEKDIFQRYLDAGIAFTNMTRARAEELVEDLIQGGEVQGSDAKARVEEVLARSRHARAAFVDVVRQEVDRQLDNLGVNGLEDLARQVAEVLGRTAETGKRAAAGRGSKAKKAGATKKAASKSAKRPAAKKPAAKKAATKKSPAKKAAAKKAGAKKAAAKKVGSA